MEEGTRVLWYTVVRPHCEMELLYNPLFLRALLLEGEGADSVLRQRENLLDLDTELSIDTAPLWPVLVALQLKEEKVKRANSFTKLCKSLIHCSGAHWCSYSRAGAKWSVHAWLPYDSHPSLLLQVGEHDNSG